MGGRKMRISGRGGVRMILLVATVGLVPAGCARFSPDGGMTLVAVETGSILGKDVVKIQSEAQSAAVQARVAAIVARPLTVDAAVEIALLNNRALQAAYNELGISEAEMVEASLPPVPSLSFAHLTGAELEIEGQLVQDVLKLLTLPRRREIAEDKFRAAQLRALSETLETASEARHAYYSAVAAGHIEKFLVQAKVSAEATSEVAKKLGETGAMPKLDQAREHAFYAEVGGDLATQRLKQRIARETLNRALGLWGPSLNYRLPDRLPALPSSPRVSEQIELQAVASRVDLQMARMDLVILAKQYGLTHATRWIDVFEVSGLSRYERKSTTDVDYALAPGPTLVKTTTPAVEKTPRSGFDLTVQIPIFDFGEARTRAAEQTYLRAVNLLIDKAVNVRADARQSYQTYRGAYDIARYYEKNILPLRETISQQTLLNYNGMLTDLFGLLTDARARISANVKAIEAKRDFWLAFADLSSAVHGGGTVGSPVGGATTLASGTTD